MVNNKNKASVSIAASSREASRMSHHQLASWSQGDGIVSWELLQRKDLVQTTSTWNWSLLVRKFSQLMGSGSHLVASDPFCHPFSPIRLTHLSTQPRWVMTRASWQYHWADFFFSFTGSCYKRSIPKLYMEWFSLFRDSQVSLTISLGLLIWLGQNLFPLAVWMTSEWA